MSSTQATYIPTYTFPTYQYPTWKRWRFYPTSHGRDFPPPRSSGGAPFSLHRGPLAFRSILFHIQSQSAPTNLFTLKTVLLRPTKHYPLARAKLPKSIIPLLCGCDIRYTYTYLYSYRLVTYEMGQSATSPLLPHHVMIMLIPPP